MRTQYMIRNLSHSIPKMGLIANEYFQVLIKNTNKNDNS